MRLVSRGFVCALFGIAITVVAWFAPWEWPAWPALAIIAVINRAGLPFAALPYPIRAAVIVAMFAANVAAWAGVAYAASLSLCSMRKERL
jgi:hypothetical protein